MFKGVELSAWDQDLSFGVPSSYIIVGSFPLGGMGSGVDPIVPSLQWTPSQ